MKLEYKKHKKREPEQVETGYYFKGEFIHRLLNKSLDILRDRVKDLTLEERHKTEEWKVLRYYFDRQTEITKRIHEKKKEYYKSLGGKARLTKIFNLNLRIGSLEDRKLKQIDFFNEKINEVKKEIKKLENGNIRRNKKNIV